MKKRLRLLRTALALCLLLAFLPMQALATDSPTPISAGLQIGSDNLVSSQGDLAVFKYSSGDFGTSEFTTSESLVRADGTVLIPAGKYESIFFEPNDRLTVFTDPNRHALIDMDGNTIIPFDKYDFYTCLDNGDIITEERVSSTVSRFSIIDRDGNTVLPAREGRSLRELAENRFEWHDMKGGAGIIDRSGREIVPCKYLTFSDPKYGLLLFCTKDDKYGVMDIDGNILLPAKYDDLVIFGPNYLRTRDSKDRYALLDLEGNVKIPYGAYETIWWPGSGRIMVQNGREQGILDEDLNFVIPMGKYYSTDYWFEDGLMSLWETADHPGDLTRVIDINGNLVGSYYTVHFGALRNSKGEGTNYFVTAGLVTHQIIDGTGKVIIPYDRYRAYELSDTNILWAMKRDGTWDTYQLAEATPNPAYAAYLSGQDNGSAPAAPVSFTDVAAGAWYHDAVQYVCENGMMSGTTGGKFSPMGTTSRAMLLSILARMDGADTAGGSTWYAKAVDWAVANGISDGAQPTQDITREELAVLLYRYAERKQGDCKTDTSLTAFSDAGQISASAVDAMRWAVSAGILRGGDGKLNPQGTATRAEVSVMLRQFAEYLQ